MGRVIKLGKLAKKEALGDDKNGEKTERIEKSLEIV